MVEPRRPAKAIVGIATLCQLAACAGGHGLMANLSPPEKAFVEAAPTRDLNKDGAVTCDEWRQYATDTFRQADVNGDGALTKDEFQGIVAQDRLFEIADFSYFDSDSDGRVTLAEADKPNPAFVLLDKNSDCSLTADEMRSSGGQPESGKHGGRHRSAGTTSP
jgi:hypothetical protein